MRNVLILLVLSGCSAFPAVDWPTAAVGPAPDLLPIDQVLGPEGTVTDDPGAVLAAEAAALKAHVARGP